MDREVLYFKASRIAVAQPFPSDNGKDGIVEWLETNGFVKWDRSRNPGFAHEGLLRFVKEHKTIKGAYTIGYCDPEEDATFWIRFCSRKDAENNHVYFCRVDGKTFGRGENLGDNYAYTSSFIDKCTKCTNRYFDTFSDFSEYINRNMVIR